MADDTEAPDPTASTATASAAATTTIVDHPLAGYASFDGRKLTLSDVGVDLVRKKTLSPSTASAVSSCGGRFAVERLIDRLAPSPPNPLGAAELGTATHQVYEDLFARPKGERGLLVGAQLLERLELDHPELEAPSDPALLAKWRSEVQTRVVGLWEVESPDEIDVVAREIQVQVDLDGIPFNGFIDRVHRTTDGLCVTDFKGGAGQTKKENARFGDPHGDQIRLYARALAAKRPDLGPITGGEVLYVFHRKRRDVDMSAKAMDGTRARYEKAWKLLTTQTEQGAFGLKTSPLCGWCPAVQVCPAALAAGKEPKVDTAEHGALLGIGVTVPVPGMTSGGGVDASAFSEDSYDPAVDFAASDTTGEEPAAPADGAPVADAPTAGTAGVEPTPPSTSSPTTIGTSHEVRATTTAATKPPTIETEAKKESTPMYDETKPWEETSSDGSLNLNS